METQVQRALTIRCENTGDDVSFDEVDVQGVTIAKRVELLRAYPTYVGHNVELVPLMHLGIGRVGGWQIYHEPDCPGCTPEEQAAGRTDVHVTPATVRYGFGRISG